MTTVRLPRSAWTDTPSASPALLDPRNVAGLAVHYIGPAVPDYVFDAADQDQVGRYLRGIRRFHVAGNGWSDVAYQWAVDQAGRRWELRGWRRQSAANGDQAANRRFGAVLALIGQGQEPTEQLLAALVDARADFRRHYPHATALRTHNAVRPTGPTSCPGEYLTRWVHAGGPDPRGRDMTEAELIAAIVKQLHDDDSRLSVNLRRQVRNAVQAELAQERAGDNPGQ